MQAALALCAEEGFASLSLRSVAREAGIAPTSFYRHFRDIDELGISMALDAKKILDECFAAIRRRLGAAATPEPDSQPEAPDAVEAFVGPFTEIFMAYCSSHNRLLRLFFQERTGSSKALRSAIAVETGKLIDFLSQDLKNLALSMGKPVADNRLLAEMLLIISMASGMEKMLNPEISDETVMTSMKQKLRLLVTGAMIQEAAAP